MVDAVDAPSGLEVAIVGLAGRFPGARDAGELWRNLRQGVESISFFSEAELLEAGVDPADLGDPRYVKARGVLEGADLFDAPLFGYSPREAEVIDPQQRVFLQCAWEALENAGYDPERYAGRIGVYAGVSMNTYLLFNLLSNPELLAEVGSFQAMLGNDKDYLPTRVSYKLNLKGPSVLVQTACSTSLVAVHLACQALLNGECEMALAGGVSISFPQKRGYLYQEGAILSPDGHCRAFDAKAGGTVNGDGAGLVVLKRLEDALADGDFIHAVIKGSAINNDGSVKVGFTAPGLGGQAAVIRAAQVVAGVDPESIGYLEAHGTGTALGDPIEVQALTRAFRARTQARGFCALGSIKSNLGHLDAAAGIAGLLKATLALYHREIPPHLHFQEPHPEIDFAASPFFVNAALRPWEAGSGPRRAGVSSFGLGGTNAHVILEEAPAAEPFRPARPWQTLLLSARTAAALEAATDNLAAFLEARPELSAADVAFTLQVGRRPQEHRRALVCRTLEEATAVLRRRDPKRVLTAVQEARNRPVVFLFPGQGAQYPGMGRELYETEPAYSREVDRCAELLRPRLGLDLRTLLHGEGEEAARQLRQTRFTQPALFVVELALARVWEEWGVTPAAMIGHSVGEYVAACLAGTLSVEDALPLVAARGRLMDEMPQGAMLSVGLPEERLAPSLEAGLSLAAVNAPGFCVVGGGPEEVERLRQRLACEGVEVRLLQTSHAFHSPAMDPVLAPFRERFQGVRLEAPRLRWVSNVTGSWITDGEARDPGYWVRQLRQPVRFSAGLAELLKEPDALLLEVGPGRTLTTLARQQPGFGARTALASLRHPKDEGSEAELLQRAAARLWLAGAKVDWAGLHAHHRRRRLPLPSYPFETRRYWVAPGSGRAARPRGEGLYVPGWRRTPPLPHPRTLEGSAWSVGGQPGRLAGRLAARVRELGGDPASSAPGRLVFLAGEEHGLDELRALAASLTRDARLLVVTRSLQEVTGGDAAGDPALLAAPEILARELPEVVCRSLDLGEEDPLPDTLLAEALADGPAVAWRGPYRWEESFEPLRLEPGTEGTGTVHLLGDSEADRDLAAHLRALGIEVTAGPDADLVVDPLQAPTARSRVVVRRSRLRWDGAPEPAVAAAAVRRLLACDAPVEAVFSPSGPEGRIERLRCGLAGPAQSAGGHSRPGLQTAYAAPESEAERKVAAIWEDLLGIAEIGRHDDFFELGGHSLLATQVASRVREVFGVEIPVRRLLEAPTVADLAAGVEAARGGDGTASPIVPLPRDGALALPLSFAQQRLWFLDQLSPGTPEYNVPFALRLRGRLDVPALAWSFGETERRHESLRTTFHLAGAEPVQTVAPPAGVPLPVVDLEALPAGRLEAEARRLWAADALRSFDLARGPLLRVALLRLGAEEHALLVTLHHIISDGWSFGVITRELSQLYRAALEGRPSPLPELPVQYADFAAWQRRRCQGEVLEEQVEYWRSRLAHPPSDLRLPMDRSPAEAGHRGAIHNLAFPAPVARALTEAGRRQRATLFMTLLAAFDVLLWHFSGAEDILVGSPIAGRNRRETEGLVGFFVNTLVLRTDLSGDPTFEELLTRVREATLGAYAHQDLPFEKVVSALRLDREASRTPLFRVWFVLQNTPPSVLDLSGLAVTPMEPEAIAVRHDLKLELSEGPGGLEGYFEYRTALFEAATIARLAEHFGELLEIVTERPSARLSEIRAALTDVARQQRAAVQKDLKKAMLERLKGATRRTVEQPVATTLEELPK